MDAESTRAMQEALQAAVQRMNSGGGSDGRPPVADLISAAITILPKLLQHFGSGEELLHRLDSLRTSDLAALREDVQAVRKQNQRLLKFQEETLVKIHEIQRQQVAAAGAVLDLAQQMARINFLEASTDDEDDRDLEAMPAPPYRDRAPSRNGGSRRDHQHRVRP